MFIVLLTFGQNKQDAPRWMEGHKAWITRGFESGMFQLLGSLVPAAGGALIANGDSRESVEKFVALDPFVEHGVVEVAIHEFEPNRTAPELAFMLEKTA